MREQLEAWLMAQRGVPAAISELRRITTGHSRAMWFVEMADGARFVARVDQGGVFGTTGRDEFELMGAAGRLGCPVATVRWVEPSGRVIGQPFFVMDFIEHVPSAREDRSLDPEVAADLVRCLHELHCADWRGELPGREDARACTLAQIDRWIGVARASVPVAVPLLEDGAAWLRYHAPTGAPVAIVHGDPGPGNFVHDGVRVIALTDWEFAHLGDPMEDWAYLIHMRGARTMPAEEWTALIRDTTGVDVTAADLRYWGAFNFFKGACANLTCLPVFAGPNPAPNMAIIGTALQQTFLRNMVRLIDTP